VDQVRELRENIKYMPAHSPYKIYIIDEVHMLSTPAFNALLKTLEEPPAHVLFMFATTEPHKIPTTILSRCQRFDLRRVRLASIADHLATICRQEGVEIATESLELIARESGGSVRDSLSLLDQVISGGERTIAHAQVIETLGVIDRSQLHGLAEAVLAGDAPAFLATLDAIFDRGHDLKKLYAELLEYLRDLWVIQNSRSPEKLVDLPGQEIALMRELAVRTPKSALEHALDLLFREESAVRLSPQPKLALEMAFFRVLQTRGVLSIDTLITRLEDLRREVEGAAIVSPAPDRDASPGGCGGAEASGGRSGCERTDPPAPAPANRRTAGAAPEPAAAWQQVVDLVAGIQPSLAATLRRCRLKQGGMERVEIVAAGNSFAVATLKRDKHMAILRKVCAEIFGGAPEVVVAAGEECRLTGPERRDRHRARVKETLNHPLVAEAIEIFNGKLVDVTISKEVEE
jgi:DNA polymerase-3 subunit gamma/tau